MSSNSFTDRVKKTLQIARETAMELGNDYIGTEHLLLGLIREGGGVASATLKALGIDLDFFDRTIVNSLTNNGDTMSLQNGAIPFSVRAKKVMEYSAREAELLQHKYVGTEHVLLACFKDETSKAFTHLSSIDITYEACLKAILEILKAPDGVQIVSASVEEKKRSKTPFLDNFSRDLTELAKEGKLDPIVGRANEIERVVQILSRRKKNNPILLGEPGVGKTAVVEGLALRIVSNDVPDILENKRVCSLDLAALVAGTKYRGQFEERIKALMTEIKKNPEVITFIDEIHTLVSAGGSENGMDAANIFKPALARGELQVIGATTFSEHRKTIEKDGALERRFQEVVVNEPSIDDSILILNGLKAAYELHHKVQYTPEALAAAVRLSERYMTTRQLPDKAIDVIDEAGSRIRIQKRTPPKEISEINLSLLDLEAQKEAAIIDMKFEEAAKVQDEIERLEIRKADLTTQFHTDRDEDAIVDEEAIIEIVSKMTGIPITKADDDEIESLLRLEEDLRLRVIGQEDALEAVAKSIRRARTGIHNPKKPMGTFMFMGPTGVGKTELAKAISELVFKSPDSLIRIDMSEYMDKHNVSRLIGAAPGFIGHEEGGQLTEAVRKRPYSVVLFDEIEKAHPDVFNILLQILDDGHITDSLGRKINFKNTVIIMTSNVGSRNLSRGALGFSGSESRHDDSKVKVESEMKKVFNPEFINRLDDAIIFHSLRHEDIVKIVDIQIGELSKRLSEKGVSITITDDAKSFLAEKSYDPAMGARPLRRNIQKLVEDNIAENFLRKIYVNGSIIDISLDDVNKVLKFA